MRTAYLMAREEPRLKHAGDGTTKIVAEAILKLAEGGETDPSKPRVGYWSDKLRNAAVVDVLQARQANVCSS
jgi:hypothetical protein